MIMFAANKSKLLFTVNGGTFTNVAGKMISDITKKECLVISGGTLNCMPGEADEVRKCVSPGSSAVVR